MKTCINHPDKEAFSICHGCGKDYCADCLDEGLEYYYCKNAQCQQMLREKLAEKLPEDLTCPNCKKDLKLSEDERLDGRVHCPQCEALIDFKINPPKVFDREKFVELLSSFNQGDIALVKSILQDAGIEYYVSGENFLNVDPLIRPAIFYVNEDQFADARELLKDLDLNIWGVT